MTYDIGNPGPSLGQTQKYREYENKYMYVQNH